MCTPSGQLDSWDGPGRAPPSDRVSVCLIRSCCFVPIFGHFRAPCRHNTRLSERAAAPLRREVEARRRKSWRQDALREAPARAAAGLYGAGMPWGPPTRSGAALPVESPERVGPEPGKCNTNSIVLHVARFAPEIRGGSIVHPLTHTTPSARLRTRGRTVKCVQQDTQYPHTAELHGPRCDPGARRVAHTAP